MKVLCVNNNPDSRSPEVPDFDYGLQLNKEYLVMGILLAENQLWYLVDEKSKPNFYPFQLFQVTDSLISSRWNFKIYDNDDGIYPFEKKALWSYNEMCVYETHYEQIVDRDNEALEIYFKWKTKLEDDCTLDN